MKRVLVTGASGFIGRHLIQRLLSDGFMVRALLRNSSLRPDWPPAVEIVIGDIRENQAIKSIAMDCDIVFHLAGKAHALSELHADDSEYMSINVQGTKNLLEAAVAAGVKTFVYFSSVKAGDTTAYGKSKLAAENLVLEECKQHRMHAACLRLSLVYGPGNKGNLYQMISAIDHGFFPPFPRIQNQRSMVHVSNVVNATMLVSTNPQANGKSYVVSDAAPYSTQQLYEGIVNGLGKPMPSLRVPVWLLKVLAWGGDGIGWVRGKRFLFDSDALEKLIGSALYSSEPLSVELGYRPVINFEEALPALISWYREVGA